MGRGRRGLNGKVSGYAEDRKLAIQVLGRTVHLALRLAQNLGYQTVDWGQRKPVRGLKVSASVALSAKGSWSNAPNCSSSAGALWSPKGYTVSFCAPRRTSLQFPKCSAGQTDRRTSAAWEVGRGLHDSRCLSTTQPPTSISGVSERRVERSSRPLRLIWKEKMRPEIARVGGGA